MCLNHKQTSTSHSPMNAKDSVECVAIVWFNQYNLYNCFKGQHAVSFAQHLLKHKLKRCTDSLWGWKNYSTLLHHCHVCSGAKPKGKQSLQFVHTRAYQCIAIGSHYLLWITCYTQQLNKGLTMYNVHKYILIIFTTLTGTKYTTARG